MKKLRTYLIHVTKEETAMALDQTANRCERKDDADNLCNCRQYMISSRLGPFELMNIPDIHRIVSLTPYR